MGTTAADWTFASLVGDTESFFAQHFDRQPLLRRGALADRVRDLITVDRLDDVIALQVVPPAYVRLARDGQGLSSKAYTRTTGDHATGLAETVVPERVYELFRSGATVTWNHLEHLLPSVRHLVDLFADTFACPAEVVGFLTPAGHDGYAPHHDPVDVFVVQIEGTKDWQVWQPPADRRGDSARYPADRLGEPALRTTLHPGDVLYLPHGTPHAAAAREQVSLHLSVTVAPRRWRDLLAETVAELLRDEAFHAVPFLGGNPSGAVDGAADGGRRSRIADRYREKVADLCARLTALAPEDETARLAAVGRAQAGVDRPREFARLARLDALTAEARVRRTGTPVELGPSRDGRTPLLVNGHRLAVPDAVADTLRALDRGGSLRAGGFLAGAPEDRSVRAARQLARLGVLQAADRAED
ncbi:JmjC domain-containing protein [Streptomyces sp. NBC_00557]|uniref:JmjC domain-containing protein n=1 Tax=Streptomyces sp. NBC_00557 TaxID=2975776 RepID=UPI002E806718|nr:cupin domain-containing protein [Streptomyces sp. NBC_00557]WUC40271.1 cupin domain-containing protein [Streptomyces sp. NBC_00557]